MTPKGSAQSLDFEDAVGRTQKNFQDDTDINLIVERWMRTGIAANVGAGAAVYGDFSNVNDYLSAVQRTDAAMAAFQALPSSIRNRFENQPSQLIEFMSEADGANEEEARELGLIPPIPLSERPSTQVGTPPEEVPTPPLPAKVAAE